VLKVGSGIFGVSDGDKGDIAVSTGVWHFLRTNGAPHDGSTDDAPYLNDQLDLGKTVILNDRKPVLLKSPVIFTVDDTGIIAPMGANVTVSMAAGAFDNTVLADRFSITTTGAKYACPLYASGVDGIRIEGLTIRPSVWTDCRYITPIALFDCDDAEIVKSKIGGFSRSSLIFFRDSQRLKIKGNTLFDTYTLSPFEADGTTAITGSSVQVTGIEGDDGSVTGSKHFEIDGNRIRNLTNGALIIAALGNVQSDGINVKGTDGKSGYGSICENHITNVAEGIDYFGWHTLIAKNVINEAFGVGIKLFHSASFNEATENVINEVGLAGIYTGGSPASCGGVVHVLAPGTQMDCPELACAHV
jgi:hypothetical protein